MILVIRQDCGNTVSYREEEMHMCTEKKKYHSPALNLEETELEDILCNSNTIDSGDLEEPGDIM